MLEARIRVLEAGLEALQARVKTDSRTSSQPPSQDKPWRPQSERSSSGRATGGQRGHPGKTLKMSEVVDEVVVLPVLGHCSCGQAWEAVEIEGLVARQVHDLPEIRVFVTEYQVEVKVCPHCARREQAAFPSQVAGQVQYGPRVLAKTAPIGPRRFHGLSTYLNTAHFIPLERTCEIMQALSWTKRHLAGLSACGATPSDGTIALNLKLAAQRLEGFEDHLKAALLKQDVLNADETGSKVNGKMHWLHVVSNTHFTLYGHHPKRGFEALEDMGVLNTFKGIVMHDCWTGYFKLDATHALCNAHLLRELRGLFEHHGQLWAGELRMALQGIYHQHKTGSLTLENKATFYTTFETLLEAGLAENPALDPVPGQRGRVKQTPGRNLALRCQQHKDAYLRFLEDLRVPFDNNGAERDIRMTCIKRKVSGGFRSDAGGETFCRIRSYISTLKKQGLNVWHGLVSIFDGQILMPDFSR